MLNKKNIEDFFVMDEEERRKIRNAKVTKLASNLRKGIHFQSPFVVNKVEGTLNLLDGNHRDEAIRKAISQDPDLEVEVRYAEYVDLTPEEEKDVFETWNIGTTQSSDDFLKVRLPMIPLGDYMLKQIPASIYTEATRVKLRLIAGAHVSAKENELFKGGYRGARDRIIQDLSALTKSDIKFMVSFMEDLKSLFGPFDNSNLFYKSTPIFAMYKIWSDNLALPEDAVIQAFKKILLDPNMLFNWQQMCKSGGTEASKFFYRQLISAMHDIEGTRGFKGIVFIEKI